MLRPHDRALTRRRSDPDVGSDLANCSSDSLQPLAAAPSSSAPAAVLAIAPGYLSSSDDESLPRAPPSVRWMMEAPLHLAEPETPPWALVAELSSLGYPPQGGAAAPAAALVALPPSAAPAAASSPPPPPPPPPAAFHRAQSSGRSIGGVSSASDAVSSLLEMMSSPENSPVATRRGLPPRAGRARAPSGSGGSGSADDSSSSTP